MSRIVDVVMSVLFLAMSSFLVSQNVFAAEAAAKVAEGAYPDLAVDAAGNVHLAYARSGKLFYKKYNAAGKTWGAEQDTGLATGSLLERSDPEIVTDSGNKPHVFVGSSYAYWDGSTWKKIDPGVQRDTAMTIDANDNIYICRRGGSNGGYLGLRVRRAGAASFTSLPDPDIANGLPLGRNDHVYGHVFVSRTDNSVHLVYRHGAPANMAYRGSTDAGQNWFGGGVSGDDNEAPSGTVGRDGTIYAVSGNGTVFKRTGTPSAWSNLGRAVSAASRDLPAIAADRGGNLYVTSFGGKYNVYSGGAWKGAETLPKLSGKSLGFAEVEGGPGNFAYAVWEEGNTVNNDLTAGTSDILFATISADGAIGGVPVGRWGRFEASVTNATNYADPYKDVSLNVTYTRPDGTIVPFWGFYDGGTTWKFRFMPDQLGTWSYSATFSDGTLGASGAFTCVASSLPGMLSKDEANPRYFGYQGGNHVLVRSFHVGDRYFASNWDDPANGADGNKRAAFLDWAQAQGYNMLSIASHYLNRNTAGRGQGWATPDLWPLNAAEWRKLEVLLDDLAARRMLVYPFAGHFGQSSDFPTNHADQARYIRYASARIGSYWNILFNVAGPEPLVKPGAFQNAMSSSDINRLGAEIRDQDPFGHLRSIHNGSGNDPFIGQAWESYVTLQGWKDKNWSSINNGMRANHTGTKPVYAQEVFWPGNNHHGGTNWSASEVRKKGWVLLFSAVTINFADMNGDSSSGFSGSMDLNDRNQTWHDAAKIAWDYLESIPFYRLDPRQDLVNNGFCLAEPGKRYLVYLPSGGTVNVSVAAGTYQIEWVNAQDPSDKRGGGATGTGQGLSSPAGGDDWILHLTPGGGGSDTEPPSIPQNLSGKAVKSDGVNLAWSASTDNVGVSGYRIFRDGAEIGTAPSTSFSDRGLNPATTYTYEVSAFDAAGNESARSAACAIATGPAPFLSAVNVSPSSATLAPGQTRQFTALGTDQYGDPYPASFVWSVNGGGSIDGSGLFTALSLGGPFTVTAQSGTVSGTAAVTVSESGPGLVAHWKLDEGSGATAADATGNGYDGALQNGPAWIAGRIGGALRFDGSDDRVSVSQVLDPAQQGTVAFWLKTTVTSSSEPRILGGHDAFEARIRSDGRLSHQFFAGGSAVLDSSVSVTTGAWVHVACTYNSATGRLEIYLDGTLDSSNALADDDPGNLALSLGTRTGTTQYFTGDLDDVRIYNRVLTSGEIAALAGGNQAPILESIPWANPNPALLP